MAEQITDLQGKKILLAVTGSIAAYKAAHLVRLFVKQGAEVQVLMTEAAKAFITPLTLATLSNKPVMSEYANLKNGVWNSHVELGLWADVMLVAPATAKTMSQMANGYADNLIGATYLSARCPVLVAPAMDLDMYQHPSTLNNIKTLKSYGNLFIEAEHGELASGLYGQGRMAEPEHIVDEICRFFAQDKPLKGKHCLVTAGPTYEAIDPVRFIGNHSSGKMGYAITEELLAQGAQVTLVTGPTALSLTHPNLKVVPVTSAQQMFEAADQCFPSTDITVLSAAVADYRPAMVAPEKIKKQGETMTIECEKTTDIAAKLGQQKTSKQFIVGFALETENENANAQSKLERKNFDMIVLNSLKDKGAGFGGDTNKVTFIHKSGQTAAHALKPKTEVAQDIVKQIISYNA
ncbi:bifunctional phosphopantothenoylcysteine decarboxylase/phosphopantothenate--cysteine ligase CoaBC [Persicobacter psychrovividus]|uniref:Coenzyme A biosynthesis bifunctional protein CoaBC n=1 Tax=Persicobacter psychrovividus TaxID=387638 RepID=A0ABM7VHG7_9BACT|nr:phosphopantothenoylcysteine decarboxylase [Persicobacter psychrovividus]